MKNMISNNVNIPTLDRIQQKDNINNNHIFNDQESFHATHM